MTKYPQVNSHSGKSKFKRSSSWRQYGASQKWRNYVGVFIVIVLVFATINGFLKTAVIKNFLGELRWDNNSSYVVALGSSPPAFFIYQSDPRRMVILTVPGNMYFSSGKFPKPLERIEEVINERNGGELARLATINFGTNFEKYAIFENLKLESRQEAEEFFKRFASISTPFEILSGFKNVQTNVTPGGLISLWWQIKGLSVEQLKLVDLSPFSEEVVVSPSQKVLGVDEQSFSRETRQYLENHRIVSKGVKVKIQNASGTSLSSGLAADLVSSVGFDLADISGSETKNAKTIILTSDGNSYEAKLLAKIFDCDILSIQETDIVIVLGQDFASKYFE